MRIVAPPGRVVVLVDLDKKNSHTFPDGKVIILRRGANNLNRRETEPVNATVEDSEHIPRGAEVLMHHNALHAINKIFDHSVVSGERIASHKEYFSIGEDQVYLWREHAGPWQPTKGFCIGERVFIPYSGMITGVQPRRLKNTLFIRTGELAGKVVRTLHAADYELIFQNEHGREEHIIRCRHFENEMHEREEIIVIDNELTEFAKEGKVLIGLNSLVARSIKDEFNQIEQRDTI